jgi:hypothetical protein
MSEIPTYADTLFMSFGRSSVISGVVIAELNAVVNVLTYRLGSRPSLTDAPEHGPRTIRKLLGVAISAAKQVHERVVRQCVNRPLPCVRGYLIRLATVSDDEVVADLQ